MKSSELEQRLKECSFRLSKMDKRIEELENENKTLRNKIERFGNAEIKVETPQNVTEDDIRQLKEMLEVGKADSDTRIQNLSDAIYNYVNEQIRQAIAHTDSTRESLDNRIQVTSDEIYDCITRVAKRRDERITILEDKVK